MKVADIYALLSIKPDKDSFRSAEKFTKSVKTGLKAIATAGAVATGVMLKLIGDTAAAADQYAKMSKQVGISVENLQGLEFAAKISGTGLADLRTGLQRFARTASDAGNGLTTAERPFRKLGVAWKDGEGNLRPLEAMLGDVADRFQEMPDGTEKTALAMETFGRAGAKLIPLLNEGSAGIDELKKEFGDLGAEISGEQAAAFEEYNDTVLRVKTALIGFRNQAVIALLPLLKSTSKSVLSWVKANKEMLKQKLIAFVQGTFKAVKLLIKGVSLLIKHGKQIALVFILWKTLLLAVAAAQAVVAAGGIRAAISLAASWLAATLPLILMAVLILALALIIEDFIAFLMGKDSVFGDIFGDSAIKWKADLIEFFGWLEREFSNVAAQYDDFISFVTGTESKRDKAARERSEAADLRYQKDIDVAEFARKQELFQRIGANASEELGSFRLPDQPTTHAAAGFAPIAPGDYGKRTAADVKADFGNTFVFNGMGLDEVHQVVTDAVDSVNESTAAVIGVDTP